MLHHCVCSRVGMHDVGGYTYINSHVRARIRLLNTTLLVNKAAVQAKHISLEEFDAIMDVLPSKNARKANLLQTPVAITMLKSMGDGPRTRAIITGLGQEVTRDVCTVVGAVCTREYMPWAGCVCVCVEAEK